MKIVDTIHIEGHTTDITMMVGSMKIDNANVSESNVGVAVGIRLPDRAGKGETVWSVI